MTSNAEIGTPDYARIHGEWVLAEAQRRADAQAQRLTRIQDEKRRLAEEIQQRKAALVQAREAEVDSALEPDFAAALGGWLAQNPAGDEGLFRSRVWPTLRKTLVADLQKRRLAGTMMALRQTGIYGI